MIRVVPVPDNVPADYEPVVMIFCEMDSGKNTSFCVIPDERLLGALQKQTIPRRMKIIKTICYAVEQVLIEYSMKPGEVNIKEI